MTFSAVARAGALVLLLLGVAACAERPGGAAPPSDAATPPGAHLPEGSADLVLRVQHVGGFTTPEMQAARLPLVSVYADGRVFLQGPVPAVHPASAWPDIQVVDVGHEGVRELVDQALAAGVAGTEDLGTPPLADVPSTRFTLVTASGTHVREVYGLTETTGMPGSGLSDAQLRARQDLQHLLTGLTDLATSQSPEAVPQAWTPEAVAAVVRPWRTPERDIAQELSAEPVPWPGPALPGEPIGPGVSCVVAVGEQAAAVRAAARDANLLTPWSADGATWSVLFRPLLPDESGCPDLVA